MATWMTHLRIADKLLDRLPDLSPIEFIMGNMAPDSGTPNPDGMTFTPSVQVSHYRQDDRSGKKNISIASFVEEYFTPTHRAAYNSRQFAFYLGYLIHLMTDMLWSDQIAGPILEAYSDNSTHFWSDVKANWLYLDRIYLKSHPGFRAFRAYLGSVGFPNTYIDHFGPEAFENRRAYITDFYLQESPDSEKHCRYLTADTLDQFVESAAESIHKQLLEGGFL